MQAPERATDLLAAGRDALARAAWEEAAGHFGAAAEAGGSAEAWEGLSRASWWAGDEARTFEAREQAYRAYKAEGDPCGAARMAVWIAGDYYDFRGDDAVAQAWIRRARALVDRLAPCPEQALVAVMDADFALHGPEPGRAEQLAREALALAEQVGDADAAVVAHGILGSALCGSGRCDEGVRHLEEAGALALAEDFTDAAHPAWALCMVVSSCASRGDFSRAEQWSRTMRTVSETWRSRHFFGLCRTAYGATLTTRGEWASAGEELANALDDLSRTRPAQARVTAVRLGELRRREGDTDGARSLFESALPLASAVIALGDLELAEGDARAALDAAERVLRRLAGAPPLDRFPALELLARALAAAGDADAARRAASEVDDLAGRLGTPYMQARGRAVVAEVSLAAGDQDGARRAAEDAIDLFTTSSAPYEAARARELLASALAALGRTAAAETEAKAARAALERLGARPADAASDGALSPRELDILRLVAEGCSDAAIAGRLFLSPHTVHRHVANIRTKLRTPSRAAAVAEATRRGLLPM
jgi:ATP/maltotriose-dependent transcriptional regulator MalT